MAYSGIKVFMMYSLGIDGVQWSLGIHGVQWNKGNHGVQFRYSWRTVELRCICAVRSINFGDFRFLSIL